VSSLLHSENPATSNENGASGGGLMSIGDSLKSQLASAFSALDESDQYDAVLTGLCAKVLDNPSVDSDQVVVALQDPIQLMEEMNSRRIKAGSRSLMALIDVRLCACIVSFCYAGYAFLKTGVDPSNMLSFCLLGEQAAVTAQDASVVSQVLSLGARNGGIMRFGNLQTDITPLPTSRSSRVRCPDGATRTRGERLDGLPDIPTDNRAKEVSSALVVATIVGFCGTVNVLGMDDISPFTNVVRLF
jgi:hypothetical protein